MEPSCAKPPVEHSGARRTATTGQEEAKSVPQSGGSAGRATHPGGAFERRVPCGLPGLGWRPPTWPDPLPGAREGRSRE